MNTDENFDDNDKLVEKVRQHVGGIPDAALQEKMENALGKFKRDLNFHPYVASKHNTSGLFSKIRGHKFIVSQIAAAAVVMISALTFIFGLGDTATYAQVNERFKTVPYFRATIYFQEDFSSKPMKIDLWMDNGRSRALTDTQVIFGRDGEIENAFDIVKNVSVTPDDIAANIIQRLGSSKTFSLETLLNCVSLNNRQELSFGASSCTLAEELTVFDKQSAAGDNETIRIWALQKSKLPVQVKTTNGHTNVDISLFYSEKHSDVFFDSKAFAAKRNQSDYSPEELAYLYYHTVADDPNK